jgi:hypothetical protein
VLGTEDRFFPTPFMRRLARERLGLVADELPSGHCPALSHPRELGQRLVSYLGGAPNDRTTRT